MVYIIISKGLSIVSARKIAKNPLVLVDKFAYQKKYFRLKRDANKYFNRIPYNSQRNLKIVKMWR